MAVSRSWFTSLVGISCGVFLCYSCIFLSWLYPSGIFVLLYHSSGIFLSWSCYSCVVSLWHISLAMYPSLAWQMAIIFFLLRQCVWQREGRKGSSKRRLKEGEGGIERRLENEGARGIGEEEEKGRER